MRKYLYAIDTFMCQETALPVRTADHSDIVQESWAQRLLVVSLYH